MILLFESDNDIFFTKNLVTYFPFFILNLTQILIIDYNLKYLTFAYTWTFLLVQIK